jgi:hypothetical protein
MNARKKDPAQRDRGGWRFVTLEARRSEARCAVHTSRVGQAAETVAWGADHDFPMCRHTFSPRMHCSRPQASPHEAWFFCASLRCVFSETLTIS